MSRTEPKVRIHIVEVDAQNFMRIRRAKAYLPERGLIPISGNNCAGKTSFLRAVQALVGGDGQVEKDPRNKDAPDSEPSYIVGKLSNGTTSTRSITGAKSSPKGTLKAKDSEGRHLDQGHLSGIVGANALRPMNFYRLRPHEQLDVILGFAPGLKDTLEQINTEKAETEELRRPHNSEVTRLGKVREPTGVRPDPVDVSAEMERLAGLEREQLDRAQAVLHLTEVVNAGELKAEEIAIAEKKVGETEAALHDARVRRTALVAEKNELAGGWEEADAKVAGLPDHTEAIAAVKLHISDAGAVNVELEPWKEWDNAQAGLVIGRAEAARFTEILKGVAVRKREAVQGADLPFTAVSFDDDGEILIAGEPLSAASGKELAVLALEVAIAEDPDLGVTFINGNELDDDAFLEVHNLAEKHDFQVLMDVIHSPGARGEVKMVDGIAHQDASPE